MSNICSGRGWLGPVRMPIPREPWAHQSDGNSAIVLCNHLVCSNCGADVRVADGVQIVGGAGVLEEAYETSNLLDVDGVQEGLSEYRLYFCRCAYHSVGSAIAMATVDTIPEVGLCPAWGCGGHPSRGLPITVDGRTIPEDADWRSLITDLFRAPRPDGAHVLWAVKWLRKARGELEGTGAPCTIDEILGGLLDCEDAVLCGNALHFLWAKLDTSLFERLPELWAKRAEWLRASPDPMGLPDLEDVLVRTIAVHLSWGRWYDDSDLLDRLRDYALQTDRLDGVGWFLARHDGDWFKENFDDLVDASPKVAAKAKRWLAQVR